MAATAALIVAGAAKTQRTAPPYNGAGGAVPRPGGGLAPHAVTHLTADKAYGSKANRRSSRGRGIAHTIGET
ncbi:hypothetical protein [Phytohabitans suffuscus]|uniref:Transposase IS4-like domain-containing protein n=1 Tax=Phytohabitans suffuscus TaxID=624315 RepID=A0A6F8Y9K3_9ACTN|nr:hypothetical protein [Phytohabitans suffuscus]BCB82792.1 hypothetical protein Psuf_001050 [Phytohabitans suffuscus]